MSASSVHIHWFRKGLRVHDNAALRHTLQSALKEKNGRVLPLFIMDTHFQSPDYVGVNRMQFLCQTLFDLDANLLKAIKCPLVIAKGKPEDVFPKLLSGLDVGSLTFEADTVEMYGRARDKNVLQLVTNHNKEK